MKPIKNIFKNKSKKSELEIESSEHKILYKYRDWNNIHHKKMVLNNEIYYASPSLFNDPFDCKINKNFTYLDTKEKKLKYITALIINSSEKLSEPDMKKLITRKMTELEDIDKYQADYEKTTNKLHDDSIGILSLSSRWNSTLMWSHYSDFHKGFCIGFNAELLKNTMFGKYKKVQYSSEFPDFKPSGKIEDTQLNMPFIKNQDWKYEQEYRFMQLFPNPFMGRIISLDDEFIKEINLGLFMPENYRKEIITIAKEKNWNIYQINRVPFKFELSRKQI